MCSIKIQVGENGAQHLVKKTGPAKNRSETYAYCLEDQSEPKSPVDRTTSPLVIDQNTAEPQNINQSVSKDIMAAGNVDKDGISYSGRDIMEGPCIFPFKYKRKIYNDCVDTGHGPW